MDAEGEVRSSYLLSTLPRKLFVIHKKGKKGPSSIIEEFFNQKISAVSERATKSMVNLYLDPLIHPSNDWTEDMKEYLGTDLPPWSEDEKKLLKSNNPVHLSYNTSSLFPDTMDVLCLNYYRPHIVKERKGPSLVEELFNFTMVDDDWPKSVLISSIVHYSQRRSSHTFLPFKPSINCLHNSCLSLSLSFQNRWRVLMGSTSSQRTYLPFGRTDKERERRRNEVP